MYVVLCSHLGRPNGEKFKKFSIGPAAEVVEEKLGTLIQLRKNIGSSEVKAACADPAPGRVILLMNPRLYIKEEGKGKDFDGNKIKTDPKKVKEFQPPLPRWLTSTAAMSAAAWSYRASTAVALSILRILGGSLCTTLNCRHKQ